MIQSTVKYIIKSIQNTEQQLQSELKQISVNIQTSITMSTPCQWRKIRVPYDV